MTVTIVIKASRCVSIFLVSDDSESGAGMRNPVIKDSVFPHISAIRMTLSLSVRHSSCCWITAWKRWEWKFFPRILLFLFLIPWSGRRYLTTWTDSVSLSLDAPIPSCRYIGHTILHVLTLRRGKVKARLQANIFRTGREERQDSGQHHQRIERNSSWRFRASSSSLSRGRDSLDTLLE